MTQVTTTVGATSVTSSTGQPAPVGTLQAVWDSSSADDQNTFVDANDAEILALIDAENITITQLDDTTTTLAVNTAYASGIDVDNYFGASAIVTLSANAATAINNITGGAGTLTAAEKYFVGVWVDRMQANGDWALVDRIWYAGFADSVASLTDWKSGDLCTNTGVTFSNGNWVFNADTDWLDTGYTPALSQTDHTAGIYIYEDTESLGTSPRDQRWWFGKDSLRWGLFQRYTGSTRRIDFNSNNTAAEVGIGTKYPLSRMLMAFAQTGSGTGVIYTNGNANSAVTPTQGASWGSDTIAIGGKKQSGGIQVARKFKASMFFVATQTSFDHADFYEGFEDFRTSLHPEILYNFPSKTGQTISYRTGDDAWIESNFMSHYRKAFSYMKGTRPELESFTALKQNNAFGRAANANYASTDTQQDTVVARYTGLTAVQESALRKFVNELIYFNLWDSIDEFFPLVFGATNGLIGAKGLKTATNNGATFDANGAIFAGAEYIDTNYNPTNDATNFTLNDAQFGFHIKSVTGTTNQSAVGSSSASGRIMFRDSNLNSFRVRLNDATNTIAGSETFQADTYYAYQRTGASSNATYKNGAQHTTDTQASTSLVNSNVHIGKELANQRYFNGTISSFVIGGSVNQSLFFEIHNRFLLNLGLTTGQTNQWVKRFTDELGGQMYTKEFVVDHYSGRMWWKNVGSPNTWNDRIDKRLGDLFGGTTFVSGTYDYADWHLANINDYRSIFNASVEDVTNYAPFNINISDRLWASTTNPSITQNKYNIRFDVSNALIVNNSQTDTNTEECLPCRIYLGET